MANTPRLADQEALSGLARNSRISSGQAHRFWPAVRNDRTPQRAQPNKFRENNQTFVRGAGLANFAEVAERLGLDVHRLLIDAGISGMALNEIDLRIPADRFARILEIAAERSRCETFGLRMAELRQLGTLGPVGLLMRDQPTLRDSLNVLIRNQRLLNDAMSLGLEEASAGDIVIREDIVVGQAQVETRQTIELVAGATVKFLRQFLGAQWQPKRVCFTHAAPKDPSMHLRIFGSRVEFMQDFNGVVCTRRDLEVGNPSADPTMVDYAQRLLEAKLDSMTASRSVIDDVRHAALLLLPDGQCSLERVAEQMGLFSRTLQRRMTEEQTSFSEIVDDIRAELAERHVIHGDRSMTEVAALLGFSAPSGFSRWYSTVFGCSPLQARRGRRRPTSADGGHLRQC